MKIEPKSSLILSTRADLSGWIPHVFSCPLFWTSVLDVTLIFYQTYVSLTDQNLPLRNSEKRTLVIFETE